MTLNRNKKIVISGGPGSGKSTLIQLLQNKGYYCFEEFSRSLLDKSTSEIEKNYFKSKPLEFSELVWKKRLKDLREAEKLRLNKDRPFVFFDRGLLDVIAYLNYINKPFNVNKLNPKNKNYDMVLLLPPWKEIYVNDNHRSESFEQASSIYDHIKKTYEYFDIRIVEIPFGSPSERILKIVDIINDGKQH